MTENWKIQVSPKLTDGTLINLRAETPDEAAKILDWSIANAGKIGEAVKALNAVEVFTQAFPGATVTVQPNQQISAERQGWNTGAQTPPPAFVPQQQAAPQGGGEHCVHGPMKYQTSKPGAAKTWQAYFCPQPKGAQQCEPVWIR